MPSDKAGEVVSLSNEFIKFIISSEGITNEDIMAFETLEVEKRLKKTPAQRLRGVIYRYWESCQSTMDENDFYNKWMERVIDLFKQKLP